MVQALLRICMAVICLVPCAAFAQDEVTSPPSSPSPRMPEFHGFVSPGFILTRGNNYLAEHTKDGSFEFAEVGLNLTVALTDNLRAGMQIFARDLGPVGDYSIKADWLYLDYRFHDWLGIRAGRTKIPWGLYNETSDIDVARVPVLLPQSVYPTQNRDFLLAHTGVELYGRFPLGGAGALEYRLYAGTIFLDIENSPSSPTVVDKLHVPYLAGGRLMWELPVDGLRIGGSLQVLRLDANLVQPDGMPPVEIEVPARLWVFSAEYQGERLLLAAEYSRWPVECRASMPMFCRKPETTSERLHGMASYRVNEWFSPGVYYSLLYPDTDDRDGIDAKQHDAALSLRFDINPHWLVKVEGHFMRGTAGLNLNLNGGPMFNDGRRRTLADLTHHWGTLLVKTTAYW